MYDAFLVFIFDKNVVNARDFAGSRYNFDMMTCIGMPEPIAIETLIHVFRKGRGSQDAGRNITSDA
jgi:hypothetical protein